ncbi:lipid II:glycine glycyltransferase FemX [Humidisolicoccus flavus]|uniref:lipid II:glycine glycyltransferase FemX n=1 Tax=Humidisolicoccus flavus TaxID=3111414 RepID=UPI00324D8D76
MRGFRLREATIQEINSWDSLVEKNPDRGQWTQGSAFAEWKSRYKLVPRYFIFDGATSVAAMALEHRSPLGRMWYFPLGPGADIADYADLADAIRRACKDRYRDVFAVRVEPFIENTPEHLAALQAAGFIADVPMQMNNSTVFVDLTRTEEEIFAGFHKNLRNHIRFAQKNDYRVEKAEPNEQTYETLYELMKTINGGKGASRLGSYEGYRSMWSALVSRGQGHFWFGYDGAHEGPQAGSFMIHYGRWAIAKDGGSVPDRAIRGGAHLIRWTAMQHLKSLGAEVYDAYVTPPKALADDTTHPHHGIGKFKRLFGEIVDHVPSHDLVLQPKKLETFNRIVLPITWRVRRQPWGIW